MLNDALLAVWFIFGMIGPPAFLVWAWLAWWKARTANSEQTWRSILRDVALCGATLEWIAYWMVIFWIQRYQGAQEGKAFEIWGRWIPIDFISSVILIILAVAGKGKGRVLTILSCIGLVLGLLAVNP